MKSVAVAHEAFVAGIATPARIAAAQIVLRTEFVKKGCIRCSPFILRQARDKCTDLMQHFRFVGSKNEVTGMRQPNDSCRRQALLDGPCLCARAGLVMCVEGRTRSGIALHRDSHVMWHRENRQNRNRNIRIFPFTSGDQLRSERFRRPRSRETCHPAP